MKLPREFWIVVTQHDDFLDVMKRSGPIAHESYMMSKSKATAFAKSLGDRYGEVRVLKVEVPDAAVTD